MGSAIGQVLSFGVGVALSPVPIIVLCLIIGAKLIGDAVSALTV